MPRISRFDKISRSKETNVNYEHSYSRLRDDDMQVQQENTRTDQSDHFPNGVNYYDPAEENEIVNELEHSEEHQTDEIPNETACSEQNRQENQMKNEYKFKEIIKVWAVSCNIRLLHVTKLMKELKNNGFISSAFDARSILSTPKVSGNNIRELDNGKYLHFGVEKPLIEILKTMKHEQLTTCTNLKLSFNVDGTPSSKSGGYSYWLILGCINNFNIVFTIGVFMAANKPDSFNGFLKEFVDEMRILLNTGLTFGSKTYRILFHFFLCDAPALAAVKHIKSHGGYFCCTKCFTKGKPVRTKTGKVKVVYPEINAPLRNNENFRNRETVQSDNDSDHHKPSKSVLELLPIDMIKHFPLEKMH